MPEFPQGVALPSSDRDQYYWKSPKIVFQQQLRQFQPFQEQGRSSATASFTLAQTDNGADNPAVAQTLSISDTTRLGPYSQFLIVAYQQTNPEQTIQLNPSKPDDANSADLTALGRSLTAAEQANGLNQFLVTREKIAIIVSADNPYGKSLTIQQVRQIFQGQITNWKQLGGVDAPIQVIGRPADNPTRLSLQNYPSFKSSELDKIATFPKQDSTANIIDSLGRNGISFAPATEVIEQVSIRVIPIDNVGIDDARYPFSQPFTYIYQGTVSKKTQDFLNFTQSTDAQAALELAQRQPQDPRLQQQPLVPGLNLTKPSSRSPDTAPDTAPINAAPIAETPLSQPQGQAEGNASEISGTWIPLSLLALSFGILGWLTYRRVQLEKKRKKIPRPAPNYVERINVKPRQALDQTPKASGSEYGPETLATLQSPEQMEPEPISPWDDAPDPWNDGRPE